MGRHRRRRLHQRPADDANGDAERRMIERFVVGDDRVDLRGGDQCRQVALLDVRRAKRDPTSDAVKLHQSKGGRELNAGYQQNRAARQLRQPSA